MLHLINGRTSLTIPSKAMVLLQEKRENLTKRRKIQKNQSKAQQVKMVFLSSLAKIINDSFCEHKLLSNQTHHQR